MEGGPELQDPLMRMKRVSVRLTPLRAINKCLWYMRLGLYNLIERGGSLFGSGLFRNTGILTISKKSIPRKAFFFQTDTRHHPDFIRDPPHPPSYLFYTHTNHSPENSRHLFSISRIPSVGPLIFFLSLNSFSEIFWIFFLNYNGAMAKKRLERIDAELKVRVFHYSQIRWRQKENCCTAG
jgi:hypothetical protein